MGTIIKRENITGIERKHKELIEESKKLIEYTKKLNQELLEKSEAEKIFREFREKMV